MEEKIPVFYLGRKIFRSSTEFLAKLQGQRLESGSELLFVIVSIMVLDSLDKIKKRKVSVDKMSFWSIVVV